MFFAVVDSAHTKPAAERIYGKRVRNVVREPVGAYFLVYSAVERLIRTQGVVERVVKRTAAAFVSVAIACRIGAAGHSAESSDGFTRVEKRTERRVCKDRF